MTVVAFITNLYYNIQHDPQQLKINERNQKKRRRSLLSAFCLSSPSSLMTSNGLEKALDNGHKDLDLEVQKENQSAGIMSPQLSLMELRQWRHVPCCS